jgi:hypothetical protein
MAVLHEAAQPPTNEALIEQYVKLRDEADKIKERHKQELAPFNELMRSLSGELDTRLVSQGTKTFSTDRGSATRVISTKAEVADWSAVCRWAQAADRVDLFERKLKVTALKEMQENEEPLPPGVRLTRTAQTRIRRK